MSLLQPSHVVVPYDFSAPAEAALEEAWSLLPPAGHLHVVHVLPRVDPTHPGVVWSADDDEPRREHARQALLARLPDPVLERSTLHVLLGDPGSQVVELARQIGAELIVTSSHGRTGLTRLALGSVAERIVRHATCAVLVVRPSTSG